MGEIAHLSPASPFSEALFLCSSAIGSHRPSSSGGISIRSLKNKHFPQKIFLGPGGGYCLSHYFLSVSASFRYKPFPKKHISHAIIINTYLEYSLLSFSSSSLFLRSSSSACMHVKNEINSLHFFFNFIWETHVLARLSTLSSSDSSPSSSASLSSSSSSSLSRPALERPFRFPPLPPSPSTPGFIYFIKKIFF